MDIEALLKQSIQMKVVEAFNETPQMIDKLVKAALEKEVDMYGDKPSYKGDGMPYMDYLVGDEIRKAISICVKEYVAENKETIKGIVAKSINQADFGTSLSNTIADVLSEEWRWKVNLDITRD